MIHHGDCLDVMPTMEANSIDSIVTDPPYGLKFMGKNWDHGIPGVPFWQSALNVIKPGGYMLAFGGTRTHHRLTCAIEDAGWEIRDCIMWVYGSGFPKGKGCLKPAWEPIILARKPGKVLPLGIDACRVPGSKGVPASPAIPNLNGVYQKGWERTTDTPGWDASAGRWPANLIHDGSDEVLAGFPVTGPSKTARRGSVQRYDPAATIAKRPKGGNGERGHDDAGGTAARFFYCAKASKSERGEGCTHPTVKPLALMRYLCKLVTPPDGLILDPFAGSGSTGKAARLEGFRFVGIEKEAEYVEIARRRIESCQIVGAS